MRVLLDATAVPADRGGVGRYLDELIPALVRQGADLVVAVQPRDVAVVGELAAGAEVVEAPAPAGRRAVRLAWEQAGLPRLARRVRADVLHSPHYTMPAASPVPVVVTLHDATFFSHPEVHTGTKGRFFRTATRMAVRRAAALVVPSLATQEEVRRFTGAPADRFHVAHPGVDRTVFHPVEDAERQRVAASLGVLDGRYVGFLGTLEPRKNVPALIRAWVAVCGDRPEPPPLVLAGGPGWDTDVAPALAAVPAHLRAVRAGYLPLGDLAGFLAGAVVVAYPSRGEGFGLPVLEAMACGAAVLTTRELSLPEVGGDAVAYCGTDEADIADGLRSLLDAPGERARLGAAAEARASGFTWDASALAHLTAYEAASARR